MMTRDADKKREQMMMFSMDDMVPKDHMLRKIDRAIDWNFIKAEHGSGDADQNPFYPVSLWD